MADHIFLAFSMLSLQRSAHVDQPPAFMLTYVQAAALSLFVPHALNGTGQASFVALDYDTMSHGVITHVRTYSALSRLKFSYSLLGRSGCRRSWGQQVP